MAVVSLRTIVILWDKMNLVGKRGWLGSTLTRLFEDARVK